MEAEQRVGNVDSVISLGGDSARGEGGEMLKVV